MRGPSEQALHSPSPSLTNGLTGLHAPKKYVTVTHGILKAGRGTFQQARQVWHANAHRTCFAFAE